MTKKSESKPLSFDEWCYQSNVEGKYVRYYEEYGDSMSLLSVYKEYHYQCYLERFEKTPTGYFVDIWE